MQTEKQTADLNQSSSLMLAYIVCLCTVDPNQTAPSLFAQKLRKMAIDLTGAVGATS